METCVVVYNKSVLGLPIFGVVLGDVLTNLKSADELETTQKTTCMNG